MSSIFVENKETYAGKATLHLWKREQQESSHDPVRIVFDEFEDSSICQGRVLFMPKNSVFKVERRLKRTAVIKRRICHAC